MKTNIAVVGSGFIGKQHIDAIKACENLELCAVVTNNPETEAQMAGAGVPCFHSISELCQNVKVDIVDICTPTFVHEQNIMEALGFGVNVMCEKPVALTLESFDRIAEAVKQAGVKFMASQVLRFWPEYRYVKEAYDKGEFGEISLCTAKRLCEAPAWSDWFKDEAKSGGSLYDLMVHDIDFVQSVFGDVESVYAIGQKMESSAAYDHISASLKFKNGVSCVVEGSEKKFGGYPFTAEMHLFGDDMILDYELKAGHNLDEPASCSVYTYKRGAKPELQEGIKQTIPIEEELKYFADCVARDVPCDACSIESTRKTMQILASIAQSLESGDVVRF